jgi:S-formylglutathione hydrolase
MQHGSVAQLQLALTSACAMTITTISENRCFGGVQGTYAHASTETGCTMRFGAFLPPQAGEHRVPLLYWLSGLTCTEENFIVKAGAQRAAALLGVALVVPDTSPRGLNIPGEAASYDFGLGAGFYVDATEAPWSQGYRMYSYIVRELVDVVAAGFPVDPSRAGIFGHSMGGHGALAIALRILDLQVSFGFCADMFANALSVGRKGPRRVYRKRPRAMA